MAKGIDNLWGDEELIELVVESRLLLLMPGPVPLDEEVALPQVPDSKRRDSRTWREEVGEPGSGGADLDVTSVTNTKQTFLTLRKTDLSFVGEIIEGVSRLGVLVWRWRTL